MKKVDLALAVNYLPACACLGKLLLLMLVLSAIPAGEELFGGYILMAAVLYLDRVLTRNIIFDASAILLAVFFANVHAAIRATSTHRSYPVLMGGLHLCWMAMCLLLLAEPAPVRRVFERRVRASKVVPVVLMLIIIVCVAHFHRPLESGPVRACRAVGFTLLAFAWIYVVGIHTGHGLEYLKDTSCQFVARLAPALYSPLWMAALFVPAAVGALVVQHMRMANGAAQGEYAPVVQVVIVPPRPPEPAAVMMPVRESSSTPGDNNDEGLEELFRMAKQSAARTNGHVTTTAAAAGMALDRIPE